MNKKILIPVVGGIVALLVMLGVSYAYFTTSISGTNSSANIVTATLGNVGYTTTTPTGTSILPGWTGEGTTSVYLTSSSDKIVRYHCTVALSSGSYTNNIYIQTTSNNGDEQVPSMTALTTSGITVSEGVLAAQTVTGSKGTEHNVTYNIIFRETGSAQNEDVTQTILVETTCSIDSNSYSNNQVLSGVMYDGNGNPIANQAMVAFSDPTYFTTDSIGHYSVTLPEGNHTIYFVPGMSMEALQEEGVNIVNNENVKSVQINTDTANNITVSSYTTYTISVNCTNCSSDAASKSVEAGETATFTLTANSGYTLDGATVTGGCTLSSGTLTLSDATVDTSCTVSAARTCSVYCTTSGNCTTNRSARNSSMYAVFTCNNNTKKTGSIKECWYKTTQCNGGKNNWGLTQPCTAYSPYGNSLYYNCNSSLSNTDVGFIQLSGSNYTCSCD